MKIKVFVSNLAKYNDGQLNGQWTTLPVDDVNKDILDKLELGGNSHDGYNHDWFISDYEAPFKIDQYDDLYSLNELAELLADYDTIEDVFWSVESWNDNNTLLPIQEWDEDIFDEYLANLTREEIARAVYFGNIQNWSDPYIYMNVYGNLESMNEYQFEKYCNDFADEIIEQFKDENM